MYIMYIAKSLVAQLVDTSWCFQRRIRVQVPPPPTIELSKKKIKKTHLITIYAGFTKSFFNYYFNF